MKKLLFLFLILNSISASTQTIKETYQDFWKAMDSENNPFIVEKGEQLIIYLEKNKSDFYQEIVDTAKPEEEPVITDPKN